MPHTSNGEVLHTIAVDHHKEITPTTKQLTIKEVHGMHLSCCSLDKDRSLHSVPLLYLANTVEALVSTHIEAAGIVDRAIARTDVSQLAVHKTKV